MAMHEYIATTVQPVIITATTVCSATAMGIYIMLAVHAMQEERNIKERYDGRHERLTPAVKQTYMTSSPILSTAHAIFCRPR